MLYLHAQLIQLSPTTKLSIGEVFLYHAVNMLDTLRLESMGTDTLGKPVSCGDLRNCSCWPSQHALDSGPNDAVWTF